MPTGKGGKGTAKADGKPDAKAGLKDSSKDNKSAGKSKGGSGERCGREGQARTCGFQVEVLTEEEGPH